VGEGVQRFGGIEQDVHVSAGLPRAGGDEHEVVDAEAGE
jgi:hypothetical protein